MVQPNNTLCTSVTICRAGEIRVPRQTVTASTTILFFFFLQIQISFVTFQALRLTFCISSLVRARTTAVWSGSIDRQLSFFGFSVSRREPSRTFLPLAAHSSIAQESVESLAPIEITRSRLRDRKLARRSVKRSSASLRRAGKVIVRGRKCCTYQ